MLRFALFAVFAVAVFASEDWIEQAREKMRAKGMNEVEIDQWLEKKKDGSKKGSATERRWPKPKPLAQICAEIECPVFDAVNGTEGAGYTTRVLHSAVWVGTQLDDYEDRSAYMAAFWRLFGYISGANSDGAKVPMTAPVINLFYMDPATLKITGSYMYFYIPAAFQDAPPQPTADNVHLTTFTKHHVYSLAIGGNSPNKERWQKTFEALYGAMSKDGLTPDISVFATAGFTRPYFGRQRQEAMYFAAIDEF